MENYKSTIFQFKKKMWYLLSRICRQSLRIKPGASLEPSTKLQGTNPKKIIPNLCKDQATLINTVVADQATTPWYFYTCCNENV